MSEKGPEFSQNEEKSRRVEINTPLDFAELFEFLANSGLENWANREDFERELEQSGLEKEDIALATKFMMCLATVNQLVFQDRAELIFSTNKEKSENFVQYLPEKKEIDQDESYWINVKFFGQTIREIVGENRTVFLDEAGHLIKSEEEAPPVSLEELLLGIAVHEVRHRLQKKKGIKLIGPSSKVFFEGNQIDDEFINLQSSFISGQKKKLKSRGDVKEGLLERKTGSEELDAVIIEKIAVSRLYHRKTSLEQLRQLISIEPEDK